jgi:hypothetical protein
LALTDPEKRRAPRYNTGLDAVVVADGKKLTDCVILDINAFGARLEVGLLATPDTIELVEVLSAVAYRAKIMWRHKTTVGTRFIHTWELRDPFSPKRLRAVRDIARAERARSLGLVLL